MHRWQDAMEHIVEKIMCGMETGFVCVRIELKGRVVMNL
jgi:hypothetical protein